MKLRDVLLGRTPEVKANLDALFSLPSAAVTLEAAAGLASTGQAAVCYKPAIGRSFADAKEELDEVLQVDAGQAPAIVREETDEYGYHWVVVEQPLMEDLVNRAHMVNATLRDRGFGSQLLCSVFGFAVEPEGGGPPAPDSPSRAYLVYLYKQGTYYPFAPKPNEHRDQELEMELRGILEHELPVESDLSRWFPLWGLPLR